MPFSSVDKPSAALPDKADTRLMRIGELAAHSQTPASTIRYYEQQGLLTGVQRTAGGSRRYDASALLHLQMIRSLQNMGFALGDIPALLRDEQQGVDHERVMTTLNGRLEDIDTLLASLQQQRNQLHALRCLLKSSWDKGQCLSDEQILTLRDQYLQPPGMPGNQD